MNMTFEHALGLFGKGLDAIRALPSPNGAATKALSSGNGHAPRALPAPSEPPKAKRGPKAKAAPAPAPKAPKAAKAKPAAVAKAKVAKPAKKPAGKGNAIAEGRRAVASGARPKLVDALGIVMGSETMTASQILEALNGRGWTPGAAQPQAYISYTLSDNKEIFARVKRGEYKVKTPALVAQFSKTAKEYPSGKGERVASTSENGAEGTQAAPPPTTSKRKSSKAPAGDPPKAEPVAEATAQEASEPEATEASSDDGTDEALETLGISQNGVAANPFDDAEA